MAAGDSTALWLHNKLGSTDDLWSGRTICSQLSQERLQSIEECFHTLQPHVKVKLLLSFLHILRRNIDQWKPDLDEILQMAIQDTDPWVSMVGEILRTFPETGSLSLELELTSSTYAEVLADLRKMVRKTSDVQMLPMECQFLNKTAFSNTAGQMPQPVKHFALKRKPKSATLRAELLQKSSDVAANKKNQPNAGPIKMRSFAKKMDDETPMKFLSNRSPSSSPGFRSPSTSLGRLGGTPLSGTPLRSNLARKDGGKIKFLDITEQPVGSKEAKRRRKVAEMEAIEQHKKEKEAAIAAGLTSPANPSYTPDYAAGLLAPATPKMPTPVMVTSGSSLLTPSPAYVPVSSNRLTTATKVSQATVLSSSTTQQARQNLQEQLQQQLGQSQIRTQMTIGQLGSQSQATLLQSQQITPQQAPATRPPVMIVQPQVRQPAQQSLLQQPQPAQLVQQPNQLSAPPKKGLSLTREQMMEAQEMFKSSNKVTRPEKALILGFMAGSRDNPCPQQGDILNIKLSEDQEVVSTADGVSKQMIADTYFQMNYSTGEWKRFKKFRELEKT
ncbi:negative elongation factor A-like [Gigantopelta aegis]|uniref:negative elongation factor A-like n=1 Tax=Gigantopelta aegis TaxID=1735272 RepID=UPI001B88D5B3|nr:negative elongation factor A-like [Gigantopelta aegis]